MRITEVSHIDTETECGKLLLMAIAKITSTTETNKTPDEVIGRLNNKRDEVFGVVAQQTV